MIRHWFTFVLLAGFAAYGQLDTSLLGDNTWINLSPPSMTLPINGSNWAYENDLKAHPFYPFFIMGPGHVVHPQDCYYYPFDPVLNKWTKTSPPVRPPRGCLTSFAVSSQDTAIIHFGGGEANHQLSQGWWDAAYRNILQGSRGSRIWVYSFNRNEWYNMNGPVTLPPNVYEQFPQYDPVHDLAISTKGNNTWVYNFHYNYAQSFSVPYSSFHSVAVDTRRGYYYFLYAAGLYRFNPDSGSWSMVAGNGGALPSTPNEFNMMAYDERHDVLVYKNGSPSVTTNLVFDCATLQWRTLTPSNPPPYFGRMAYNTALNAFMLLGGSTNFNEGRQPQGIWFYRYSRDPGILADLAAAPKARLNTSGGTAKINWEAVDEPGVTGYNVYRGTANPYPKNFALLNAGPVTDTFFTDNTASAGAWYSYKVCAIKNNAEGRLSRHLYTRPGRALNVMASVEESTVMKVSWDRNPEPDITGYNIYRAKGAAIYTPPLSSSYTKVNGAPVDALEFMDTVSDLTDGVARGYVVTAVNAFGCESGVSPECTTFPNPPEFAYTIPVAGKMRMGWQPPRRTKILGVNFYRILGTKQNTTGLITDTLTTGWDLPPNTAGDGYSLMGKTYVVRCVNLLGQEGYMTDQISPTNSDYGFGVVPPSQRFDYAQYDGTVQTEQTPPEDAALQSRLWSSPNPFNPASTIHVFMPQAGRAELKVHDMNGRLVRRLADNMLRTGQNTFTWQGNDDAGLAVAAGIYVYRLTAGGKTLTCKTIFSK